MGECCVQFFNKSPKVEAGKGRKAMEEEKQQSVPVLPWMRHPVDVTRYEQLSLCRVPFLDRRYFPPTIH